MIDLTDPQGRRIPPPPPVRGCRIASPEEVQGSVRSTPSSARSPWAFAPSVGAPAPVARVASAADHLVRNRSRSSRSGAGNHLVIAVNAQPQNI